MAKDEPSVFVKARIAAYEFVKDVQPISMELVTVQVNGTKMYALRKKGVKDPVVFFLDRDQAANILSALFVVWEDLSPTEPMNLN